MGHRQIFNNSQFFEIEQDWSHGRPAAGQSYDHMGRAVSQENGSFSHPTNPISINGLNSSSQLNLESGSLEHSSTYFRSEGLHVHAPLSAPPHDVFPHCPAGGSFNPPPELNATHVHSNHYNRHGIHEVEGGLLDHTMSTRRGPFKRKRPGVSMSWERGGTSSMYGAGSSSNSFELHREKPTSEYRDYFSDSAGLPSYMGNSLSIGGEDSPRNVRSRSRLDLEPNPRRTHSSSYSFHPFSSTTHLQNHLGPVDVANLNADRTAYEQNHIGVPPPARGRFHTSENNSLSHEMNQHYAGRNPTDFRQCNHDSISSRNPVTPPRYLHGFHAQTSREGQNSYSRRAIPPRWTDMSSSHFGQAAAIQNGQHFLSETHNSRYPRPPSAGGWHNNHREGRSRIPIERFQSLSSVADARDRMGSEALMMLDHSYLYGFRNLFDQYRDMRLDVDSMSYEELLALGERIGNVNTGLPEDVFSKCLRETRCHSPDKAQGETSCAICLEEYRSMDKVGTIKNCGHVYHFDCIKKWLSMKNMCPICKAPAVADSSNKD